jgi:hypothetical protein
MLNKIQERAQSLIDLYPARIGTVKRFLEEVKPGMEIFIVSSFCCEPSRIDVVTVLEIGTVSSLLSSLYREGSDAPIFTFKSTYPYGDHYFVSDAVNVWHGVFLSYPDARQFLIERRAAYRTDPELIAEVDEERAFAMDHVYYD